ncbi:DUF927 domain-containing protein [Lentibacillus saliphilus]|uniref:DUF927 domain-containing protein n=1 Tax=Lentibacillus saliphilus TaxID=2737028 RepID=UPI001C30DED4|nr:DUF927 domain-containing protein [Lentibacillus saliphilus]
MSENKKGLHPDQGKAGTKNLEIVDSSIPQFDEMFNTDVKIVKLKGFSDKNKTGQYKEAKAPVGSWQKKPGLSSEEIKQWINENGWIGLVIPKGYDLVDIDDNNTAKVILEGLKKIGLKFHTVKTPNGYHFYFKSSGKLGKQNTKSLSVCGAMVDYRLSKRGYVVIPSPNINDRSWEIIEKNDLDTMPVFFEKLPKNLDKEENAISLPISTGSRNDKIHKWLSFLREANKWEADDIWRIGYFIAEHLCSPSYIETDGEEALNETIKSVLSKDPSGNDYDSSTLTIPGLTTDLSVLDNRPGPGDTSLPYGWKIKDDSKALYRTSGKLPELTSHSPILITGTFENLSDRTMGLVVSYLKNNKWYTVHQNRDVFMTQNKLIELSSTGFPVSSNNARKIIGYLEDYEAINSQQLPLYKVSEQQGFIEDGFLIGNTFINKHGVEINQMSRGSVTFTGADKGDAQFVEGFSTNGNLNEWIQAIEKIKKYPRVLVGLFASFASVLAPVVKSSLFIYELAGETSKGKTIALRTFASVWGNPDEIDGGIVRKWNTTPVNLERMAGIVNHLPLFLDDTKEANERYLAQSIYQLASGQGKGRGSIKGTQRTKSWRNVIFSTGEQKITTFSKDGGTAGRTISILGMPFNEANKQTYKTVHELDAAINENYGLAGREYIKYLLKNRDMWPEMRKTWIKYRTYFADQVADINSVAGRLAGYMGLIALAAEGFTDAFQVDWEVMEPLEEVWETIVRENVESDRPLEAIRDIFSHIRANRAYFKKNPNDAMFGTCWGEWFSQDEEWDEVNMYPSTLDQELEKLGYEPKAMIKSWADRGWLNVTKGRGHRKQIRRKEDRVDFISFKREALSQ